MQLSPSFEEFARLAGSHRVVPVWREVLFDVDTAVTAYAKLADPPFGFLLESVVGGEQLARYTFLGTRPASAWRLRGRKVDWWTPENGWTPFECDDPLADFDRRLRERTAPSIPGLPRLWGGAVGFFSYDVVRLMEHLPEQPPDDLGLPDAVFLFTDVVLAIDNLLGRARAIASVEVEEGLTSTELRSRYDDAGRRVDDLISRLADSPCPPPIEMREEPASDPEFSSSMTRGEFEAAVERAKEYIRAGDIFQVVISQRLGMTLEATPFELYRVLRSVNPSPYLYFLELDGLTLVGSSPEVLVRVEDGTVTVRPGPRRRIRHHPCAGAHGRRALFPRPPYREPGGGPAPGRALRGGRPAGLLPRRDRVRSAQDPSHGDHRRAGAGPKGTIRRSGGTRGVRRGNDGHCHHDPHRGRDWRQRLRPGRRWDRGRLGSRQRV